jgi:hypothetical protein
MRVIIYESEYLDHPIQHDESARDYLLRIMNLLPKDVRLHYGASSKIIDVTLPRDKARRT